MTVWYVPWIIFIWQKVVHTENTGFDVTWSWKPVLHLISLATLGRLCLQQRSYVLSVFRSFCLWGHHLLLRQCLFHCFLWNHSYPSPWFSLPFLKYVCFIFQTSDYAVWWHVTIQKCNCSYFFNFSCFSSLRLYLI